MIIKSFLEKPTSFFERSSKYEREGFALLGNSKNYQLDFKTPGKIPLLASFLICIRDNLQNL